MIARIILFLLDIFDFFHKKKIKNFFKKRKINHFELVFDIGGHKGESLVFFLKYFEVRKIISFEPSLSNFKHLQKNSIKLKSQFKNSEILIENKGIGKKKEKKNLKQHYESSSSTINDFNEKSDYFKRKNFLLNIKKKVFKEVQIDLISLEEYINENKISKIDLVKIDTEGYEFEVLKGLGSKLSLIKFIMFEHHFDDMLQKNYTFKDISNLIKIYNFRKIYKLKMPFRKSFEYVYINEKIANNLHWLFEKRLINGM